MINKSRIVKIIKTKQETPTIKSLFFYDDEASKSNPGQFLMIWIPGIDEIPISVSSTQPPGITVRRVGEATDALCSLEKGDKIGIKGPFGNGFTITGKKVLVVGGGVGVAVLLPLITSLVENLRNVTVILGAKTKKELLLREQIMKKVGVDRLIMCTDDGSSGLKKMASDQATEMIEKNDFDQIYTCGPEKMMHKIFEVAEKRSIPLQATLERYMKCGFGLCGSCCIGSFLVCKDGPILDSNRLKEVMDEFGKLHRNSSGKIEEI
ncbi:MAG: dihydroorotate dehydrogenase electron transfer subunit [Candidatus Jordarchaeum sp.]|uniref:dihydroorotate dehydrogenase electron transfer subunit n=1 Tax=Candidatus Jordarchaeum sp. TaxID=2823881 RepID=UPI004049ABC2